MTTSKKLLISTVVALLFAVISAVLLVSKIEKEWKSGSFGSIIIKIEHTPALDQNDNREEKTK